MLSLLLNNFKKVLMLLLIGMLLMTGIKTVDGATEYFNYSVDGIKITSTADEEQSIPAWQQREFDIVIRVGEFDGKQGKRVYIDEGINWKDIPTDIKICQDNQGHYIQEYDINLKLAKKLYNELKEKGVNVDLQIANGKSEDLNSAGRISNTKNPYIYFSIHHNYFNESSSGYFITYNKGDETAKNIANRVSSSIEDNGMVNRRDPVLNDGWLGELNKIHNSSVGILGEFGFFSNYEELKVIMSDRYTNDISEKMANELVDILNDYWNK